MGNRHTDGQAPPVCFLPWVPVVCVCVCVSSYFRSTQATRDFLGEWVAMIENDKNYWDQNAFNDLLRKDFKLATEAPFEGHAFRAYHSSVAVGILPVSTFCNGHTFFVQVRRASTRLVKSRLVKSPPPSPFYPLFAARRDLARASSREAAEWWTRPLWGGFFVPLTFPSSSLRIPFGFM